MEQLTREQIDASVQAWQDFSDAIQEAIDALVKAWEQFRQAIIEIANKLFDLPARWRYCLYRRLRHRCQWMPQRWAAFVALRCPLWVVVRLGAR